MEFEISGNKVAWGLPSVHDNVDGIVGLEKSPDPIDGQPFEV